MTKSCAIVVPIYKGFSDLDRFERLSYRRLLDVFKDRDIIIISNKSVDIEPYLQNARNKDVSVKYFSQKYFKSTQTYNRLLMDRVFYSSFLSYKYILIYQLDAYVFEDRLDYWISCGYDYIGAPWFSDYGDYESGHTLWEVGNGGLSLRKVAFYYHLLSFNRALYIGVDKSQGIFQYIKSLAHQLGFKNTVRWHKRNIRGRLNEDCFLSYYLKKITNRPELIPHIPPPKEAALFAFEKSPSYLYKLNGSKLPMGCHAFMKYEYESFWSKYIH